MNTAAAPSLSPSLSPSLPPSLPLPLQASLQALLALVDADRERQCSKILDDARSGAVTLRGQARAQALVLVRLTFDEQRRTLQARVAAAQARLATQQRLHEQQRSSTLLALAWQQLPAALQARWAQPAARAAWVAHVLATAHARLPAAGWRIVHTPDWPADGLATAADTLARGGHGDATFDADATLSAGLKVRAAGNLIDGSLHGLLADRAEIDAALLRRLETAEAEVATP